MQYKAKYGLTKSILRPVYYQRHILNRPERSGKRNINIFNNNALIFDYVIRRGSTFGYCLEEIFIRHGKTGGINTKIILKKRKNYRNVLRKNKNTTLNRSIHTTS